MLTENASLIPIRAFFNVGEGEGAKDSISSEIANASAAMRAPF